MRPFRTQIIVGALAIALLLVGGWFLVVSPRLAAASDLRQQTDAANGTAATLRSQIASLQLQAADLPAQRRRLQTYRKLVPPTSDMPGLINSLTAAARTAQADLVTISPASITLPSSTAPSPAQPSPAAGSAEPSAGVQSSGPIAPGSTSTAAGSGAAVIPVSITVGGKYFILERFLTALENLPRALVVNSVALIPDDTGGASGSTTSPTLTATVSLSAYTTYAVPATVASGAAGSTATPTPTPPATGSAGSQP